MPCRPSPGSRRVAGRSSGCRRRSPPRRSRRSRRGTRIPGEQRPRRRPAAAATTAATSRRSSAPGPSVAGTIAAIPRRSQVRVIRAAISPRLAMKTRRDRPRIGGGGARLTGDERVNRVRRDTPPPTDPPGRAADRSRSTAAPCASSPRSERRLGWAEFVVHRVGAIVAISATSGNGGTRLCVPRSVRQSSRSGAQPGRRFSVKARKPSCASSVTRCRAITRAVCHFDDP